MNIKYATLEAPKNSIRAINQTPALENDGVTRVATTPIDVSHEATKSIYSYTYLVSATYPFKDQVQVQEKLIKRKNGRGNLDYGIESCTTRRIISLIEVKKDDLKQGFAQAIIQLDSSLGQMKWIMDMGMKDMVEKVLGHIIWLLEEPQKADSAVNFEE
ncbi:hypothetical protein GLOIN_2v1886685 [Rhizophagus irregularis DAOM 181602=DAOM 197198]|uniref:Uncharacterized protein n=1 Tax=Rhizophagus irregularis (strain DAOM 181602 / DAOM 197198 / MUCL 43194) TaxID=747089 RepID=A0A2P4NK87_RHIID|nr:hypothetical protein GLOIN_2v1886685 [Rhizophagus irregularis DAOM 181602=DAOM 197198]POG53551.1 hypothetical protein GLOIN_2v1886685 [Rhizophagus irregularis DAOM 181602=DAOM 197198]|eukprot:XP_025164158.1 hypothetical protein GLOIN_2v1886685 [Rhizophagus irregularis DAOM 181602=DAOM 197198]